MAMELCFMSFSVFFLPFPSFVWNESIIFILIFYLFRIWSNQITIFDTIFINEAENIH